jgi:hypothetical protein
MSTEDDRFLQAIRVSEAELEALAAFRDGGRDDVEVLVARGMLDNQAAVAEPYASALAPLLEPELVVSAQRRDEIDDERRVFCLRGETGAMLGRSPAGGGFITAFDAPAAALLVAEFLELRAWEVPAPSLAFRVLPQGDSDVVELLSALGAYARVSVRSGGEERSLAWVDAGDGRFWSVRPAGESGSAAVELAATTGRDMVGGLAALLAG